VGAVDESLGQVHFAALVQVLRKRRQNPIEYPLGLPFLEPPMTGRVRRIASRKISPRRARAQNPENSVQDVARISPRPTTLLRSALVLRLRHELLDGFPLLVCEVHLQVQNTFPSEWKALAGTWSNFDHLARDRL